MKKKYVKRDYTSMRPIEVYDLLRYGELKKFPNNYLDKETIKEITRHVLLKEMKLTRSDIITRIDHNFLSKYHMGGFRKFFDNNDYKVIIYSLPEMELHPWEFRKVEPGFWNDKENQKAFLLWVMKKENINPDSKEDLRRLTARIIINYGGSKMLKVEPDIYTILQTVIEDKFKEWEIMKVRVWKEEKTIAAIKWLVEEKLHYTPEQACQLQTKDFKRYNLDGMLQKACNHSVIYALNLAYGDRFVRTGIRSIELATNE